MSSWGVSWEDCKALCLSDNQCEGVTLEHEFTNGGLCSLHTDTVVDGFGSAFYSGYVPSIHSCVISTADTWFTKAYTGALYM